MTLSQAINAWQQQLSDSPWHWCSFEAWCHQNDVDVPQHQIEGIDEACQPCSNMTQWDGVLGGNT